MTAPANYHEETIPRDVPATIRRIDIIVTGDDAVDLVASLAAVVKNFEERVSEAERQAAISWFTRRYLTDHERAG